MKRGMGRSLMSMVAAVTTFFGLGKRKQPTSTSEGNSRLFNQYFCSPTETAPTRSRSNKSFAASRVPAGWQAKQKRKRIISKKSRAYNMQHA